MSDMHYSLGDLIKAIEAEKPGLHYDDSPPTVSFDFAYFHPHGIHSWRGDYAQLAIGYTADGDPPTVEQFLKDLYEANGKMFEGWKGGHYTMRMSTPLWVARPDEGAHTVIHGVREIGGDLVLETRYEEW